MKPLKIYIQPRKGRPKATGVTIPAKIPETYLHEDVLYYFAGADLSKGTVTYTETKPVPPLEAS